MKSPSDLAAMFHAEYPAYVQAQRRELADLNAALAEKERRDREARSPHRGPIADLTALGIPDAEGAWIAGVIATRVWLLEIASAADECPLPRAADYETRTSAHGKLSAEARSDRWLPTTPFKMTPHDEWLLWQYVQQIAQLVVADRLKRKFGKRAILPADVEEARLRCGIANDTWERIRAQAAWVMRGIVETVTVAA